MRKILSIMVLLATVYTVASQSFTETTANTKLEGRSIRRHVLRVDCPHTGDSAYTDTGGLDLTTDYHPQELMRAIVLTAGSGNIGIVLAGGGQMVIPIKLDTNFQAAEYFTDWQIKKILADSISTYTGRVYPIW